MAQNLARCKACRLLAETNSKWRLQLRRQSKTIHESCSVTNIGKQRAEQPSVIDDRRWAVGYTLSQILLTGCQPSLAAYAEPENALSLPTWIIHVSSVLEWAVAMRLVWQYGEVSGNSAWKGLTWGMIPLLGGAFAACTWHFFYNSPDLSWIVTLQSSLTMIGNFTCWWAAYRIFKAAQDVKQEA